MGNGESSYRRYLDGEEAAFDEIMSLYRDSLTFFIDRFVRDPDTAEDLAIDTFMYLIVHPLRYNFRTSLKTYLFMIGRSRALDWLKHQKKLQLVPLMEELAEYPHSPSLEELLMLDEQRQAVHRALDRLPADQQTAVHLVYLEDLSYEDAGKIMRKSRKQVANLLYRAKEKLRIILGEEGAQI